MATEDKFSILVQIQKHKLQSNLTSAVFDFIQGSELVIHTKGHTFTD